MNDWYEKQTIGLLPERAAVRFGAREALCFEERRWSFQPAWLQILMDDPPDLGNQLTLRSHGNCLVIGSFLTPGERLDLARALRSALAETRAVPGIG